LFKGLVPTPEAQDRSPCAECCGDRHQNPKNDVLFPDAGSLGGIVACRPAVSTKKSNDQRDYQAGKKDY
jgi:hypothetical protein